jgi:hypothetical protein
VLDAIADFISGHADMIEANTSKALSLSGRVLRQAVEDRNGIPVMISK